ncbi:MAG: HXXEE domain-containing protein [Catenulispora sp.]|nr:HXXEE domain-containing protein [Catenulispora sp.]
MSATSTSTTGTTATAPGTLPTRQSARTAPPALSTPTRLWMWGWILSFLIHDGEEALYIVRNGGLKEFGVFQTTAQCLAGILFELMLGTLAVLAATRPTRAPWAMPLFGLLMWGWTLHGVMHLGQAISGHGYTFGSVTAGPVVVAYGALMLIRLYRDRLMSLRQLPLAVLGGAVLGALFVYSAHQYGSILG